MDLENNHGAMLDDSDSEGEGEGSDGEGEGNDDHRQVLLERELLLSESGTISQLMFHLQSLR